MKLRCLKEPVHLKDFQVCLSNICKKNLNESGLQLRRLQVYMFRLNRNSDFFFQRLSIGFVIVNSESETGQR